MPGPQLQEGSADSYKYGSLIRRLPPIRLAHFTGTPPSGSALATTHTFVSRLNNLTSGLTAHIAVALVTNKGQNQDPILASNYPANPGTMQLTPIVNNPQAPPAYLRPVFQDPTKTTNVNAPQPQNIPFGWSFVSEGADLVRIDVTIDPAQYAVAAISADLLVFATIEYTGNWWATNAVEQAIGQVLLEATSDNDYVQTAGG